MQESENVSVEDEIVKMKVSFPKKYFGMKRRIVHIVEGTVAEIESLIRRG